MKTDGAESNTTTTTISLQRSSSTSCYIRTSNSSSSRRILTSTASTSSTHPTSDNSLVIHHHHHSTTSSTSLSLTHRISTTTRTLFTTLLRTLTSTFSTPTPTPTLGRKVTGTLFGHRNHHVTFTVQHTPTSDPVLIIQLATTTSSLVKEMSSGLVRLALECRKPNTNANSLYSEPVWTMYCNGKKSGYATTRKCVESDHHVLSTIRSVSVGAGVIPPPVGKMEGSGGDDDQMLYMRARFERVVGSKDSEAFYMLNPDGNGGTDLSIFLLRL